MCNKIEKNKTKTKQTKTREYKCTPIRMAISQNPVTPRASADMRQEKLPIIGDRKEKQCGFYGIIQN